MRKAILLALCILLFVSIGCPVKFNPWTHPRVICVDGVKRVYYVHPPSDYDGTNKLPLLMALHPFASSPALMEQMTHFSELANREGFIAVYPEGLGLRWNDGGVDIPAADDVTFLQAVIDDVSAEFNVDGERVYIVGASNGAFMTYRMVCEVGYRFAAAAVVMGVPMPEHLYTCCDPPVPMPIMMIHGTADPIVPFDGTCNSPIPGVDIALKSFFDSMWLWVDRNGLEHHNFFLAELPDTDPDDCTTATEISFGGGEPPAPVHCYIINGGGHTWPGSDRNFPELFVGPVSQEINASEVIWSFFREFKRTKL